MLLSKDKTAGKFYVQIVLSSIIQMREYILLLWVVLLKKGLTHDPRLIHIRGRLQP
jgi:hypothetical protein